MAPSRSLLVEALSSLAAASILLACGGEGATPSAAPDATATPDGGVGDPVDAGGGDAPPTGPSVRIVNLSWGRTTTGTTANFVLRNETEAPIESVEAIELQFGSDPEPTVFNIDFANAGLDSKTCRDWTIAPGNASGVIELGMKSVEQECSPDYTTCTNGWLLDVPCDQGQAQHLREVFPTKFVRSRPDSYPLTLRLRGLMADGAPWSATATGPLRN